MEQSIKEIKLTKISIRLDDYHASSNHAHWRHIVDICIENEFDVFIGVIPENKDTTIQNTGDPSQFIENLIYFDQQSRIKLVLHGYNHLITHGRCVWKLSERGEFFENTQRQIETKLSAGVSFFKENNLQLYGYFAPAHGYSKAFLEIVRSNYKHWLIIDNYFKHPVSNDGLIIIPQIFNGFNQISIYSKFSVLCFHPEMWQVTEAANFERKIKEYSKYNYETSYRIKKIELSDIMFCVLIRWLKSIIRLKAAISKR